MKKKIVACLLVAGMAFGLAACGNSTAGGGSNTSNNTAAADSGTSAEAESTGDESGSETKYEYSVGASATSGSTYRWIVPMTELVNKYSDIVTLTPVTTTGSVENVNLVLNGQAPLGGGPVSTIDQAINGKADWEGNPANADDMKFVMSYMPDFFYIAVPADSDINTLADMVGKTIGFGEVGSGTYTGTVAALEAMGYSEDDFDIQNISYADAATGCAEGWIDAVPIYGSPNNSAILEMQASPVGLKIVGPSEEEVQKALAASDVYIERTFTGDISYGQENDLETFGGTTGLFCSKDIPDEVTYEIVKIVNEHLDELSLSFELGEFSAIENTVDCCNIIDYAGGTLQYLKELGLIEE